MEFAKQHDTTDTTDCVARANSLRTYYGLATLSFWVTDVMDFGL